MADVLIWAIGTSQGLYCNRAIVQYETMPTFIRIRTIRQFERTAQLGSDQQYCYRYWAKTKPIAGATTRLDRLPFSSSQRCKFRTLYITEKVGKRHHAPPSLLAAPPHKLSLNRRPVLRRSKCELPRTRGCKNSKMPLFGGGGGRV